MAFSLTADFMLMTLAALPLLAATVVSPTPSSRQGKQGHHHHHVPCLEPDNLQERWESLYTSGHALGELHETFYVMPILREAATNHTRRHNFNMQSLNRTTVFSGPSECPNPKAKDFLHDGDPCPVYHTLNTDPLRFPRLLLEAQCRCQHCQGITHRRYPKRQAVTPTCEGIYYHVRVLRRLPGKCVDNVYQYAQAWEKVQIGCACRLVPTVISS
ncbi:interleukin 17-like protein [Babylonia areolata]|uniref:interleukin 17-like protein n=1 Tax=Babylonia areolata TaxID=304850 RepID=UPI003FD384DC